MNVLTRIDPHWLLEDHHAPCVSILMPTHRRPPDTEEDPVRYRRLLAQATNELRQRDDLTTRERQELLAPLEALTEPDFWIGHLEGLAVYRSRDGVGVYRLPGPVAEQVTIGDRFSLWQLLPFVEPEIHFFVLALSQGEVTLYEGDRLGLSAMNLPDLPADIQDAVGTEPAESPLPFYSHRGGRDPMYTGTLGGVSDNEPDQARYFRIVDRVVCQRLAGDGAPLLLAAPAEEWDLYRQANHYPHLIERALDGNHDRDTPELLYQSAWPLVAPIFDERRREVITSYHTLSNSNRATDDLATIAIAAREGRILALLLAEGGSLRGKYDPKRGQIILPVAYDSDDTATDQELLNALAEEALRYGGEVYVVPPAEMPVDTAVAAILRYSNGSAHGAAS